MNDKSSPVLVTGGAGYIGSHVLLALQDTGIDAVVIDDLSRGRRELVPDGIQLVVGNAGDRELVGRLLRESGARSVIHLAGDIVVPESVAKPLQYYRNNVETSRNLIEACVSEGVLSFVFSSTAAVYGSADGETVSETAPLRPESPYARSKLMVEWILEDVSNVSDLRYAALRYFNVAGADPAGRTGLVAENATHLIKVACEVAVGRRDRLTIFGDDYETADGTCRRDFIHVSDLASAHVAVLSHLRAARQNVTLNCGYGRPSSVLDVIRAVEQVTGNPLPTEVGPRRPGDPVSVVADSSLLRKLTDWSPAHDSLEEIISTALAWERSTGV